MTFSKISFKTLLGALTVAVFLAPGCDKHDHTATENITTIELRFTGPGVDARFSWDDTDGDGSANTIDTIQLPPLTGNIQCQITLFDKSETPALDLTGEIEAEGREHLFTFNLSNAGGLTISNLSTDADGKPLGLTSTWQTDQPTNNGALSLKLYHEPSDKNNNSNPGGEVDIDVTFPVVIK